MFEPRDDENIGEGLSEFRFCVCYDLLVSILRRLFNLVIYYREDASSLVIIVSGLVYIKGLWEYF